MRHRSGAAGADPALRRHADHRALHRRRRSAIISTRSKSRRCARWCHDLPRQAEVPSPGAAEERAGLSPIATTRARSRRCAPAAATTSITGAIIQACFELAIEPHRVAKISGIGCSSKTPTYFLGKSHGFNSVHGRMPSVLTGANLANRDLIYLGVSGDGDSASIGLGQFAHALRRGVNMVYIVENNGVYGLTKGQFSATADRGSKSKRGVDQQRQRDRSRRHGAAARRDLRGALVLRRQGAAGAADQGGDRAQGRGLHRRDLARASRSTIMPARPRASTTCASTTRR